MAPGMSTQREDGPMSGLPTNMDTMTPEEIETMIQRLQVGGAGVLCPRRREHDA